MCYGSVIMPIKLLHTKKRYTCDLHLDHDVRSKGLLDIEARKMLDHYVAMNDVPEEIPWKRVKGILNLGVHSI